MKPMLAYLCLLLAFSISLVNAKSRADVQPVPDRQVADQRTQHVLVEDLRHETLLTRRNDRAVQLRDRHAGGLLSAVLERVKREVGQARDLGARREYAEHPALVARSVTLIESSGHRFADPTTSLA